MTATATDTFQAYCRGCACPTFVVEGGKTYPPDSWYCDNCYGTMSREGRHGNTGPLNPIMSLPDFETLLFRDHGISIDTYDTSVESWRVLPPLQGIPRPAEMGGDEDYDEDDEEPDELVRCDCGNEAFEYREQIRGTRYYYSVVGTRNDMTGVADGGITDDDCEVLDSEFVCTACGSECPVPWSD